MRCHYEVLGVERNCSEDDLKKTYRKLALRWHPDKNPDNTEECTRIFHEIGEAYEVLIDPQERAFYDKHREAILKGGDNYVDKAINLWGYFNSSVYTGFGDDEKGFFAVYRTLFNLIDQEDDEFRAEEDDFVVPKFGSSNSSYDEVVRPFYAYWQGYSTRKSYVWTDKYDIRQAPNRPTQRAMEKENKKSRDAARKERNEEVRALVLFVRKRDIRVKLFWKELEEKQNEAKIAFEQKRVRELQERYESQRNYEEQEWLSYDKMKDTLDTIEAHIDDEFGGSSSGNESAEDVIPGYYCVACEKTFKTEKALENHERSRKHKENVEHIKKEMEEEMHSSASSMSLDMMDEDSSEDNTVCEKPGDKDAESETNEWNYKHQDSMLLPQNIITLDVKKQQRNLKKDEDYEGIWMKEGVPLRRMSKTESIRRGIHLHPQDGSVDFDASEDKDNWVDYMNSMGLSARDSLNLPRRKGSKKSDIKKRKKKELSSYPLTKIDSEGSLSSDVTDPCELSRGCSLDQCDNDEDIRTPVDSVQDTVASVLSDCIKRVSLDDTPDHAPETVKSPTSAIASSPSASDSEEDTPVSKTGKKKSITRKRKKVNPPGKVGEADALSAMTENSSSHICNTCNKTFPSRNKLFQHVKKTNHALRVEPTHHVDDTKPLKGKKKGKKSKKNSF